MQCLSCSLLSDVFDSGYRSPYQHDAKTQLVSVLTPGAGDHAVLFVSFNAERSEAPRTEHPPVVRCVQLLAAPGRGAPTRPDGEPGPASRSAAGLHGALPAHTRALHEPLLGTAPDVSNPARRG